MSGAVLDIKDLDYRYPLGDEIFENTNLRIAEGEFVVLIGKNGSGKSTLINLLLGYRTPLKGTIEVLKRSPIEDMIKLREEMFFMSHSLEHDENSSVDFILRTIEILYPEYSKEKEKELLDLFEIDRTKKIYQLSLGQKVRVQIIAGIASNTKFLLIDEITAVLDPETRNVFSKVLLKERNNGRSILMATNIPGDSKIDADRIICVKDKKVVDYADF